MGRREVYIVLDRGPNWRGRIAFLIWILGMIAAFTADLPFLLAIVGPAVLAGLVYRWRW